MRRYGIILILLIFIFSIGAICAADTTDEIISGDNSEILETTQDITVSEDNQGILEATQNEIIADEGYKTFSDLNNNITDSSDSFDVMDNYRFNNDSDYTHTKGIYINKENFEINGNNHIIDANNLSRIFIINATNVIINNLVFINANAPTGSVFFINSGCSLTTNNVTLINNTANGGIINVASSEYFSNDDKFIDSTSSSNGVITLQNGYLEMNNALMRSSKELSKGFIQSLEGSNIYVYNSIFANTTSKYTTAVRGDNKTVFENCSFINLHALMTAGAIGLKTLTYSSIKKCTFINVTSEKNGGAIFVDAYNSVLTPLVEITDSNFINCSSEFGGAILQLEGNLTIDNCNFTNNNASLDGGALYTSWTDVAILNSRFNNNSALYDDERGSFGGAIFCDMSILRLKMSELINNSAQYGGAIYLYDSSYFIDNNTFHKNLKLNGAYDDIYSVFGGVSYLNNTYSSEDSLSLNNTYYNTIIDTPGMKITAFENSINVVDLPSRFDLRDWGWVTPVRDQGQMGSCWTFGSSGAMESSILRYLGFEIDLSENNMQDVSLKYYKFGTTSNNEGGTSLMAACYALSWLGVFSSEHDEYDELGKISPIFAVNSSIHFQDVVMVSPRQNLTDNVPLKEAILKYGGLSIVYYAAQSYPYCNVQNGAQYYNVSNMADHCVTLIGWDDNYSKDNFYEACRPPDDGAWIIKNSWGNDVGDDGYFYISYYDTSFVTLMPAFAFILNNTVDYNKNYQYDIQGDYTVVGNSDEYINHYVAIDDDLIAGVGTYFNNVNTDYSLEIYVNEELRLTQNGISPFIGYHTIPLDSYIPIRKGDHFSVKIKSDVVPVLHSSRQHYIQGSSQYCVNGVWLNASDNDQVCCIKAYTVADNTKVIDNNDISVTYGSESYFSVKVVTDDGHAVGAGAAVDFTINGKKTSALTDGNGIAKVKITEAAGTYDITTALNGKTYKNTVTVKAVAPAPDKVVLTAYKAIVKKTAKKFILKAKLKVNGKLVKGKKITFKFNGKTYKAKTDKKGMAKVTIKKNVIKKLKKGKKYTVKVTYLKNTKKTTVKVK